MRVGVVLGAGGPLGWAYHLGVLDGIRTAIGREPANADRIVATSAGAPIAAGLLGGASIEEILEVVVTPPGDDDRRIMEEARAGVLRSPLRALRPMAPNLIPRIGQVGPATAAVGLLPAGIFPTLPLRRLVARPFNEWPSSLWVPSVRIDDGQLVVFGRDITDVAVADAVEATSAVPGVFRPKLIDGARYVDGAVASSTHADTLVAEDLDVVLISSPMTRPGRGPIRARARRQLAAEVAALRANGTRTIVLSPNEEVLVAAEGFPRQRPEAGAEILAAAQEQTVAAFAEVRNRRRAA